MSSWLIAAIIPQFFWTGTNYVDQFVARRYFMGHASACIAFSTFSNALFISLIYLFAPDVLDVKAIEAAAIFMTGLLYMITLIPYIVAISENDVSTSLPIFQIIPFFTSIIAWIFLRESLSFKEIIAGIIIITGSIGMMWEFKDRKFNLKPLLLLLVACILFSTHTVILRIFADSVKWYQVSFWILCGWLTGDIFWLIASKKARAKVIEVFKGSRGVAILWDMLQQSCDLIATSLFVIALSLAPTAAHVSLIGGIQPFMLLSSGLLMGRLFPQYFERHNIDKYLAIRYMFALVIFAGIYFLSIA